MQIFKMQTRLWRLISDGRMDLPEQLIQVKMVFPGDIRQGVEGLRGTTHAQQAEIHERLQGLWMAVQKFLYSNVWW